MMKTKTGIIAPPKEASGSQKLNAWLIDLGIVAGLTYVIYKYFPISSLVPQLSGFHQIIALGFLIFFLFMVIPNSLLSQTVGTFLLGLKVLKKESYKRLSYSEAFRHSLFLPGASEVIHQNHKKHKNTNLDVAFFFFYHAVVTVGVSALIIFYTIKTPVLNIDSIVNYFKKNEVVETIALPVLKKIVGTVLVTEKGTASRPAVEGEELLSGSIVVTQEKSSALIAFGVDYLAQIRIAARSQMSVDELMKMSANGEPESSIFNLVKGAMTVSVTNKKKPINLKVKTKYAVLGVRGTQFAVISDDVNPTLVAVREGTVDSTNLLFPKNNVITANMFLLINKDGRDKEITNAEAINKLDWNLDSPEWKSPEVSEVLTSLGDPVFETAEPQSISAPVVVGTSEDSLVRDVTLELEAFKFETKVIEDKLTSTQVTTKETEDKLTKDLPGIEGDITCLSASRNPCKLYFEKELISRGFPSLFGTPRLIEAIIADLNLYKKEQNEKIAALKADVEDLKSVLAKRQEVLAVAQTNLETKLNLDVSLTKLRDKTLLRR